MTILVNKLKLYKSQAKELYSKHIKKENVGVVEKKNDDSAQNHYSNNPIKNKLEIKIGNTYKPNDEIEVQIQQDEVNEEKLDN